MVSSQNKKCAKQRTTKTHLLHTAVRNGQTRMYDERCHARHDIGYSSTHKDAKQDLTGNRPTYHLLSFVLLIIQTYKMLGRKRCSTGGTRPDQIDRLSKLECWCYSYTRKQPKKRFVSELYCYCSSIAGRWCSALLVYSTIIYQVSCSSTRRIILLRAFFTKRIILLYRVDMDRLPNVCTTLSLSVVVQQ